MTDFRDLVLCWVGQQLDLDDGEDDPSERMLPRRTGSAVYKFLGSLDHEWPEAIAKAHPEAVDDMLALIHEMGYREELSERGNAKDCNSFLRKVHRELARLADQDVSLADIAAWVAYGFAEVANIPDEDDTLTEYMPMPSVEGLRMGAPVTDPAGYDRMLEAAVARARGRGLVRLPDRMFRFALGEMVSGFVDAPGLAASRVDALLAGAGRAVSGVDALLAAEAAGATLHDLVVAINRVGRAGLGEDKDSLLAPSVLAAWKDAFAQVDAGPGTATARLTRAAYCLQFAPKISRLEPTGPSVYLAEIAALRRAAEGGVAISDLVAAAFAGEIGERAFRSERLAERRRALDAAFDEILRR